MLKKQKYSLRQVSYGNVSDCLHSISGWREIFESARRETNLRRLPALIAFAEDAILLRWQELTRDDAAEREELATASADLWELKVRKFKVYDEDTL